jgi:hypothetical protein
VTPITATLRAGAAISDGISASANTLGNLTKTKMELNYAEVRMRPRRRIGTNSQLKVYDEDLAIVNLYML